MAQQTQSSGTVLITTMPSLPPGLRWNSRDEVIPANPLLPRRPCKSDEFCIDPKELTKDAALGAYYTGVLAGPPGAILGAASVAGSKLIDRAAHMSGLKSDKPVIVHQGGYMVLEEGRVKKAIEQSLLLERMPSAEDDKDARKDVAKLAKAESKILAAAFVRSFKRAQSNGIHFFFDGRDQRLFSYQKNSANSQGPVILDNLYWPLDSNGMTADTVKKITDFANSTKRK